MLKKIICLLKKPTSNYPKTEASKLISSPALVKKSAGLLGLIPPLPASRGAGVTSLHPGCCLLARAMGRSAAVHEVETQQ